MDGTLDNVWKALSDPTRRSLLDLLRGSPRTTGDLADAFPDLSRYAVMKHLSVLESAGLVLVRREGRKRWNHLNAVPVRQVYERWVSRYEDAWAGSLLRLKHAVETGQAGKETLMSEKDPRIVEIEERVEIGGTPDQVYKALTDDIGRWFWSGEKNDLTPVQLEPFAGGRFYRQTDNGDGDLYGMVTAVRPGKILRLEGTIGGKYATASVFVFKLEATETGCALNLSHRMAGQIMDADLADYQAGWRDELGSLKRYVETGKGRNESE